MALLLCGAGLAPVGPAAAHERSISYSSWEIRGRDARVVLRVSALDVSRLPWAAVAGEAFEARLGAYFSERLVLEANGGACSAAGVPRRLHGAPDRLVFEWRLSCPEEGELRIRGAVLLDVAPSHLHFVRLRRDGSVATEQVLSQTQPSWELDRSGAHGRGGSGAGMPGYVALGAKHIATGYDHLVFLFALLLAETALVEVAKVVTGFTVGHSVTLGLASLGVIRPQAGAIEALIGLSIVIVAMENVWLAGGRGKAPPRVLAAFLGLLALAAAGGLGRVPGLTLAGLALFSVSYFGLLARSPRPLRLRWAVAFVFGLVHGFGFAGALIEADLPAGRLVQALFGFNAGVEAGQLAVVALAWPLLRAAGSGSLSCRFSAVSPRRLLVECGSAAAIAVGVFWFVTRAYG